MRKITLTVSFLCVLLLFSGVLTSCSQGTDKEELYTAVSELLPADGYTTASYKAYTEAYEHAKQVYLDEKATALEIDNAIKNLSKAKNALVKTADFSQLKLAIEAHENINASLYTTESYSTYLSAYNSAVVVYNDDSSSQNEINSAVTSLNNAIRALVKIPDSSSLQQLLQEKVSADGYTSASYKMYEDAYDAALLLVQDQNASRTQLLTAENLLKQTKNALVPKGDPSALSAIIKEVEQQYLVTDSLGRAPEDYYTSSGYAAFTAVYDQCVGIVATADASSAEMTILGENLKKAAESLVSLSRLLELIDEFAEYAALSHYYSSASYEQLASAVSEAINVAKAENPTHEQVRAAEDKVIDARSKLERRAVEADHLNNKQLLDKLITVGTSSVTFREYMNDYAAFFEKVTSENLVFAYYTEGETAYIHYADVDIVMKDGYLKMTYSGGAFVPEESIFAGSFDGISFNDSEFDLSAAEKFGAPTEYSKRTENVMGVSNTIATLTYISEDGSKMIVEYNTIRNFILSIELVDAPDAEETPDTPDETPNGSDDTPVLPPEENLPAEEDSTLS